MKFKEELKKVINSTAPFELCLMQNGGYFIGVKKILSFSYEEISVCFASANVRVFGSDLKICKLSEGDLAFTGNVTRVEWV